MNQHHLVSVTRLNTHIYCSKSSLPHCWCFIKDNYHQSCCKITDSFIVKRSLKWCNFCFRSSDVERTCQCGKKSLASWIQEKPWTNLSFFSDLVCQSILWRILFHSYHLIWVRGEERAKRCQCTNRQFGRCSALRSLSVGSSRRLFWQLQQLDEGRKRSPTNHLFLKPYFFRS